MYLPQLSLKSPQRTQSSGKVAGDVRKGGVRGPSPVPDQATVVSVSFYEHHCAVISEVLNGKTKNNKTKQNRGKSETTSSKRHREMCLKLLL